MKNLKLVGIVLALLALIVVPAIALAQSAINVSITAPANGVEVLVGQSVNFAASATGGNVQDYRFNWTWGDGDQTASANNNGQTSVAHTFDQLGVKTVEVRVIDLDDNIGTRTITVNVVESTNKLTISNVNATPSSNSAVITWTTNKPATSRVIYDTVSHAGEVNLNTAPNYGYANSTGTDNDLVTSHSVTVTGLSASTQYFFRVISEIPAN